MKNLTKLADSTRGLLKATGELRLEVVEAIPSGTFDPGSPQYRIQTDLLNAQANLSEAENYIAGALANLENASTIS